MKGDLPMSAFVPQEAAANAMMGTPGTGAYVYPEWADDPVRSSSTKLMMGSARARLKVASEGNYGLLYSGRFAGGFADAVTWDQAYERGYRGDNPATQAWLRQEAGR